MPFLTTDIEPLTKPGVAALLAEHHAHLARTCRALLGRAATEDTLALAHAWAALETELLDHMAAEEEVILPDYTRHAPVAAQRIRDDHARLRALITPIGVEIDLHEIRLRRLAALVDALDAHALEEDTGMYFWAARHVTGVSQRMLVVVAGRALGRA